MLLLQLISLPVLCDTDATSTESWAQPTRNASVRPPTRDTEVLLLGLKPDTSYNATVYSQASGGTEGQPLHIDFKTSTLEFAKWLQPGFLAPKFCLCDCGSEFSLASQVVLQSEGVFWKR